MRQLFPPGGMPWNNRRHHSAWREFNFVFNQIKRAIEPQLSFQEMFESWNDISKSLSECHRNRKYQLSKYIFNDIADKIT